MTGDAKTIKLAFESEGIHLQVSQIVPLKAMRAGTKESKKYLQILRSVKAIGLVEAPVVSRDRQIRAFSSSSTATFASRL